MADKQPPEPDIDQVQKEPDFGEPINLKRLLALAKLDERDIDSAIRWFDEHASDNWKGALSE